MENEEVYTTTMSNKGQVVIPDPIKRRRGLKAGTKFAVTSTPELVIFKKIELPSAKEMLEDAFREGERQAKKLGIKNESDVQKRMIR
jgi:AbrB family looped-hinge helix DNA binding protein